MKVEPLCKMERYQFPHSQIWLQLYIEQKKDILWFWTMCNYKSKGFFSNKTWQIAAPSVVTPKNQYFPDNDERMSVHCLESGCIGKYTPLGPRDFPQAGILHPSALEIALGLRPRAISRASGCKIPTRGKSRGPRWVYFQMHPDSRQCTDILSELAGKYWFCGVTTDGSSISKALICQYEANEEKSIPHICIVHWFTYFITGIVSFPTMQPVSVFLIFYLATTDGAAISQSFSWSIC